MPVSSETVAIVNPTKGGGLASAREQLAEWAHASGVAAPHVEATSARRTGEEQARSAVAAGADLVLAWGGDGTVRAVATALAGTDVPLGILPAGTGNLLARNLDIPLDLPRAARVAFTGRDRRIDVMDVGLDGEVQVCTVMAGMGFDAEMIDAPELLKEAFGAGAYVLNASKAVWTTRMRVGVAVDGAAPRWFTARSVLVANVGGLIGGLDVAPESDAEDGLLHVVVLPLGTPRDWVRTATRLWGRHNREDSSRHYFSGRTAWVVATTPQARQVDGDPVTEGNRIQARVRPGALTVRVPASAEPK